MQQEKIEQVESPAGQRANSSSQSSTPVSTGKVNPFLRIGPESTSGVVTQRTTDHMSTSPDELDTKVKPDFFDKQDSAELVGGQHTRDEAPEAQDESSQERFDELPIEMISLTDR